MIAFFQKNRKTVERYVRILLYAAVCMPLIVAVGYIFPFVFPKAIFFQICVELALIGYGALACVDRSYLPKRNALLVCVGVWVASIVMGWLTGVDKGFSFWSKAERMDGVFMYLHAFAFFVMLAGMFPSRQSWMRFVRFNALVSVVVGCVALLSKYAPSVVSLGDQTRLAGTFGNPAFLATYFVVMLFLAAYLFVQEPKTNATRWVWMGVAAFSFLCVFMSGTRGAYVGIIAGAASVLMSVAIGSWKQYGKYVVAIGCVGIALAVSLVIFRGAWNRISPFFASRIYSVWEIPKPRLIVWQIALDAIRQRPVFGWGSENFLYAFNQYFKPELHTYEMSIFDRPHNKVLDLAISQGIAGLVAYLVLFGYMGIRVFARIARKTSGPRDTVGLSIIVGLLVAYFVQDLVLFEMPSSTVMLFLLFALVYWVLAPQEQPESAHTDAKPVARPAYSLMVWYGGVGVIILSLIYGIALPMRAASGVVQAARALNPNAQDPAVAVAAGRAAYVNARNLDTYLNREVDVAFSRRLKDFATISVDMMQQKSYQDAAMSLVQNLEIDVRQHPLDYDARVEMGSLLLDLETRSGITYPDMTSLGILTEATRIAPKREDAYQYLLLWAMQNNKKQETKQYADILVGLNPNIGVFWFYQASYEARWGTSDAMRQDLAQATSKGYDIHQHPGDWELIASGMYVGGKYSDAIQEFSGLAAIQGAPWDFTLRNYVRLIELYTKTGNRVAGHAAIQALIARMPQDQRQPVIQYLQEQRLYY